MSPYLNQRGKYASLAFHLVQPIGLNRMGKIFDLLQDLTHKPVRVLIDPTNRYALLCAAKAAAKSASAR